jgi:hypothetical protein
VDHGRNMAPRRGPVQPQSGSPLARPAGGPHLASKHRPPFAGLSAFFASRA